MTKDHNGTNFICNCPEGFIYSKGYVCPKCGAFGDYTDIHKTCAKEGCDWKDTPYGDGTFIKVKGIVGYYCPEHSKN